MSTLTLIKLARVTLYAAYSLRAAGQEKMGALLRGAARYAMRAAIAQSIEERR